MQWKWWHAQNEGEEIKTGKDFVKKCKGFKKASKAETNINIDKIALFVIARTHHSSTNFWYFFINATALIQPTTTRVPISTFLRRGLFQVVPVAGSPIFHRKEIFGRQAIQWIPCMRYKTFSMQTSVAILFHSAQGGLRITNDLHPDFEDFWDVDDDFIK